MKRDEHLAYIIGVALGDGNLSNPNGRALRLRITCDNKYPHIMEEITNSLHVIFPRNKVSRVKRKDNCTDLSVYSNSLSDIMPWSVGAGSKIAQRVGVPQWIKENQVYIRLCLRGLFQTDGSIYTDRGYTMLNFTNANDHLARDVRSMCSSLGYKTSFSKNKTRSNIKFTVRLSSSCDTFIREIALQKC